LSGDPPHLVFRQQSNRLQSSRRREWLLFTCSDYSGNDDTGLGPDVLDVVAVEIATAVNLAAGGSGVSGVWLCGKSTTGRAHADGTCEEGGGNQQPF
jgi:hypothetical protein